MGAGPARLRLLGVVRAEDAASSRPLAGAQPQLVLVATALRPDRLIARDELAELLWPQGRGRHWEGALRGVISKVRAFLEHYGPEAPRLEHTGPGYRLSVPARVSLDVEEAADLVGAAVELRRADRDRDAATAAGTALDLLAEPLLPGVDAPWLDRCRDELHRLHLSALRTASLAESSLGHHDRAIDLAATAVALEPWDEASHRARMAAHLAAQDRAGGLRAYGECVRILADELGVPPSDETRRLHLALLGAGSGTVDAGAAGRRPPTEVPFVGREAEMDVLRSAWGEAARGDRRIVVVRGEPGAGKTRLAVEAVRDLGPGHVLYGRASPERTTPFEPIVEALGRFLSELDDRRLGLITGRHAGELAHYLPELADRLELPPGDSPAGDRQQTLLAVRSVISLIAVEPTVIVVDDVQWADVATLQVLRHLMVTLDRSRVLWILNQRDDLEPSPELSETLLRLHELAGCRTIVLDGLDATAVAELLAADGIAEPGLLAPVLGEQTGGNPFYLNQVLSVASEDPTSFDPHRVPDTVSELVRHRVALLDRGAQDMLALSAVIGVIVDEAVLEPAATDLGLDLEAVDELVHRHFLVEVVDGGWGFAHGIVRDAVIGRLTRTRRRRLHRAVAHAVAAVGRGSTRWAATLAHHLVAAEHPADAPAAVDALVAASDHALTRYAYDQAVEWSETALQVADRFAAPGPGRAALLRRLGAARRRAGDFGGARQALEDAIEELRHATDRTAADDATFARTALELVAHGGRGVAVEWTDERRAELLEEAARRLGGDGDALLVVGVHAELALALLLTDQRDRMRLAAEEAERRADSTDRPDVHAQAIVASRLLRPHPDQSAERLARTEPLMAGAAPGITREQLVRLHMWRITDRCILGDRAGFENELDELTRTATELDQPYWRWLARSWSALHTFLRGDAEGADAEARDALDAVADLGHPEPFQAWAIQMVGFRLQQGRGAEIVDLLSGVASQRPTVAAMRCGLAFALAQAGEDDEANRLLDEMAVDDFAIIPDDANRSPSLSALAEAANRLGRADLAPRLLELLSPFRDQFVVVTGFGAGGACWGPYSGTLGSLRAMVGDRDGAEADFDAALAALDRFGAGILRERVAAARASALDREPEQGPGGRAPGRADSEVVDLRDQDRADHRGRR